MRQRRAFTLLEILVAASMFIVLMALVMGSWSMLNRNSRTQLTRIEARQQLRTTMAVLRAELQSAYLVFDSYAGSFAGTNYHVIGANGTGGKDLLYAIPESSAASPTWKICGVRLVDRGPTDPNPNTQDLVEQVVEAGVATNDDPISFLPQLPTMTLTGERSYNLNVIKGSGRFSLSSPPPLTNTGRTACLAPPPVSVVLHLDFQVRPEGVSSTGNYTMTETYETEVFLGNQPPAIPP